MANLIEAILAECNRCRELVKAYEEIGPVGLFGKTMILGSIRKGEAAVASGDAVECVAALKELRGCE